MTVTHFRREMDRQAPWYPQDARRLRTMIDHFAKAREPQPAFGLIAPHAGYAYSGECANLAYSSVEIPRTVLVLALDHRSQGVLGLWPGGLWETPFGDVPPADELIDALRNTPGIVETPDGHPSEHSGDNQLPFLKFYRPDVRVAVLNVGLSPFAYPPVELADILAHGDALAETVAAYMARTGDSVLTVASSDLSHEAGPGNLDRVHRQDADVRRALENFDEIDLFAAITERGATMCGSVPVILMLRIARRLGASHVDVLDQRTSADTCHTTPDYVVGYLSARVV